MAGHDPTTSPEEPRSKIWPEKPEPAYTPEHLVMLAPNFPKEAGEILQRIKRLCAEFGHDAKGEFTYHDLIVTWQFIASITVLMASAKPRNPPEIVRHRQGPIPTGKYIAQHRGNGLLHAACGNQTACGLEVTDIFKQYMGLQQITCTQCQSAILGPT
jgi:hypothetical protein